MYPSEQGDGIRRLLSEVFDEVPVIAESIRHARTQLQRYRSGEMDWSLSAVNRLMTDVCVLRDWKECCTNDEYNFEYVLDTDSSQILKICTFCGCALDLAGGSCERPSHYRIANGSELVAARVIK